MMSKYKYNYFYININTQKVDFSIPMKDNTFLFVGSVATTIGFGNVTPKTQPGQVICIVFAVIRKILRKINHILNKK